MNYYRSFLTPKALAALALAVLAARPAVGEAPTKRVIERPAKEVIAARSAAAPVALPFDNPKVAPGRVVWHPSFAAACKASQVSGKPVLLFQMMGKLDEQFC
jgi:hypothetical protein